MPNLIQYIAGIGLLALLILSNHNSYNMGKQNGKIELCDQQDAYYVQTMSGTECINKQIFDEQYEIVDGQLRVKKELQVEGMTYG